MSPSVTLAPRHYTFGYMEIITLLIAGVLAQFLGAAIAWIAITLWPLTLLGIIGLLVWLIGGA